ncbi:hypothetical protein C3489_03480 [Streptomyces sp. Ru71]|uniref:hypothetical protein n=1 Tax=Streptomyces sp. Ru71 TaxID=2080746 RepID=UPI000CDCEBFF|nr:hypothetical protein [Streptomyces sp. Ru71]POX56857.1 hypothetical protein C3489_03480 [Streptomyces sp. Ru71]
MGGRTGAALLILGTVLAAASPARASTGTPESGSYAFDPGARTVAAAPGTGGAAGLAAGHSYRSTLTGKGPVYYRLDLDGTSNAYVSATAVPPADAEVSAADGLKVAVQDADGHSCSYDTELFGASRSPHPVTAWGAREIAASGRTACRSAGSYYVVVERAGRAAGTESSPQPWQLELTAATEPPLARPGPTRAPEAWDSASATPPPGTPASRPAGAGFATAPLVGEGAWQTAVRPGQTLYYKVPVDWGQRPAATVELGGTAERGGYTAGALELALFNPVRAHVTDVGVGYDGTQKSAALPPVPPVAYRNRYAARDAVSGMRFAGSYYLVVHLAARVADRLGPGALPLTLRVRVDGEPQAGPGYAGRPSPRDVFGAAGGAGGAGASGDTLLKALAVGGIGTGTVLLAVLGGWTALARRRAAQMRTSAQNPTA